MPISFSQLQAYLDAIAVKANLDVGNSRHGVFWRVPHADFVGGYIPNKLCNGQPIPIIDNQQPENSAFFVILKSTFCSMPKMPKTGPFISDAGYAVALSDGTTVTGLQIINDIEDWLRAGSPEHG